MRRVRWLCLGALAVVAVQLATCKKGEISDSLDAGEVAETFCEWLFRCGNPFEEDYATVEQCREGELFRHADPEACTTANADFKDCLSQLTCQQAEEAWPIVEPLLTQSDAGVPDEEIPCGVDLFFYARACGEFECNNGETVNRKAVCNRQVDCADRSDEIGCPR